MYGYLCNPLNTTREAVDTGFVFETQQLNRERFRRGEGFKLNKSDKK